MADVKMPKSVPCQFDKNGWGGPCNKPSNNGWCSKHEKTHCVSCGEQATQSCDAGMGGLTCGAPICDTCHHDYDDNAHVTEEVYRKKELEKEAKRKEIELARTAPEQIMNTEFGVPITLRELLKKGPTAVKELGFRLVEIYYLELEHGLMGFFPAIFVADKSRIVFTMELGLMEKVWRKLSPRKAGLRKINAYVNERLMVGYTYEADEYAQEERKPFKLLTDEEYHSLRDQPENFRWAFGLMGDARLEEKIFFNNFADQAKKIDPTFVSSF